MKIQILFAVMICIGLTSFAEVKPPGTAVPFRCGKNEIAKPGTSVVSVCQVKVEGAVSGPSALSVSVNYGNYTQMYFYESYTPAGLHADCGISAQGTTCIKHYKVTGLIDAKGMVTKFAASAASLPNDKTVVYTASRGGKSSLSGKFQGLDFSTSNLQIVFVTQGI